MSFRKKANRDTIGSMLSCATDQTFQTEGDVDPFLFEKTYPMVLTPNQEPNQEYQLQPTIPEDHSSHEEREQRQYSEREPTTCNTNKEQHLQQHHLVRPDSEASTGSSEAERVLTDEFIPEVVQSSPTVINSDFHGSRYESKPLSMPPRPQRRGRNLFPPPTRNFTAPVRPLPDPEVYKRQQLLLKKQKSAPSIAKRSPPPLYDAKIPPIPKIPHKFKATGERGYEVDETHEHQILNQHMHNHQRYNISAGNSNEYRRQASGILGCLEQNGYRCNSQSPEFSPDEYGFRAYAEDSFQRAQRSAPLTYESCPKFPDFLPVEGAVRAPCGLYNYDTHRWTPVWYDDPPKAPSTYGSFVYPNIGGAPSRPLPPTPPLRYQETHSLHRSISSRTLIEVQELERKDGSNGSTRAREDSSLRPNESRSTHVYFSNVEATRPGNKAIDYPYSHNSARYVPYYGDEFGVGGKSNCTNNSAGLPSRGRYMPRGSQADEFNPEHLYDLSIQQPLQQKSIDGDFYKQAPHHSCLRGAKTQAFDRGSPTGEEHWKPFHNVHEGLSPYSNKPVSLIMKDLKKQATAPENSLRNTYRDCSNKYSYARKYQASDYLSDTVVSQELAESATVTRLANLDSQTGMQELRNATNDNRKMQNHTTFPAPVFDKQGNWVSRIGEPLSNEDGIIVGSQNIELETAGTGLRLMSEVRIRVERTAELTKKFKDLPDFKVFWKLSEPDFVEEFRIVTGGVMSFAQDLRSRDSDFGRKVFQGIEEPGIPRISIMYDGVSIFVCNQ